MPEGSDYGERGQLEIVSKFDFFVSSNRYFRLSSFDVFMAESPLRCSRLLESVIEGKVSILKSTTNTLEMLESIKKGLVLLMVTSDSLQVL